MKLLLEDISSSPATANRYKATFSLIYREAVRNRKVSSHPARLVAPARGNNERLRWLHHDERTRLFTVMEEHYPEYLPERISSSAPGCAWASSTGLRGEMWASGLRRDPLVRHQERHRPRYSDVFRRAGRFTTARAREARVASIQELGPA